MIPSVPEIRITRRNSRPLKKDGQYVVYWMIAQRRTRWNFALQHAVRMAESLQKPLVIFEALRCNYEWASDRIHRFVLQGMAENQKRVEETSAFYFPYVEPEAGHGKSLLSELARPACAVVTDEFPSFFLPRMLHAAGQKIEVTLESVDSNGLLPMTAGHEKIFTVAHSFRRFLQKTLPLHCLDLPEPDPLAGANLPELSGLPKSAISRWASAEPALLEASAESLSSLPIDHSIGAGLAEGGSANAERRLETFLTDGLPVYADRRNDPESDAASGLSPYLHFGHIASHEIFARLIQREGWTPKKLATKPNGSREGWWGMSSEAESFLDELVTWRELGYNMCSQRDDYYQYESLPEWARVTLEEHESDPRPHAYPLEQLESADTHDELWNAAQRQLLREGRMHNYLRMLWGKKILEWSLHPREALRSLIQLNNRYALDGRNPNSYSGIFWCLGRYDRAWGPERPIFGKVRYMSSESTARKLNVKNYLHRYGPES